MPETSYDLAVIGAGPGGYVAAVRAAQLGLRVAVIEMRGSLGGACLNVGCIPSKALLTASEKYAEARGKLAAFGVKTGAVTLDLAAMMDHKDKVVRDNTAGIEFLFRKNKIAWIRGKGRIAAAGKVTVAGPDGAEQDIAAKNILIATGSGSSALPGITIDGKNIVSSTGALAFDAVPEKLVVVGGGVIGLELGSVWMRLGAQVTVVEYLDRILPGVDGEAAAAMKKILERQGMRFRLGAKLTAAQSHEQNVTLALEPASGGAAEKLDAGKVLVCVGRTPYTEGLGLDTAGVARDAKGRIAVDARFQTNVPGIYAIGDVIAGPMLAHKAEDEGVACAEILAGQSGHVNYDAIPGVVYTGPELAFVGKSEEELKAANIPYKAGKFPFLANGRARVMAATEGFVKILADARGGRVLGCVILGHEAGTLIAEVVMAMEFGASSDDIARTCHAHPTLGEAVKEAALGADNRALHI